MPLPHLEIVRVVRRRHLDEPGAELGIDDGVGDDRELAADQREASRVFPTSGFFFASSGLTATAVSPSIVSGRVVATTM